MGNTLRQRVIVPFASVGLLRTFLALSMAAALFLAAPALAEEGPAAEEGTDPVARVVALETLVARHQAEKALQALPEDASQAVDLYSTLPAKDPGRARVVKLLGSLARHRDVAVAKAGLAALAETKDEGGARYVKPYLKPTEEAAPPPLLVPAIEAAAKICDDGLVEPLIAIVDDSKNYAVAAKALEALGSFQSSKRKRERILEEVARSVQRDRPGGRGQAGKENQTNPDQPVGNRTGQGAQARWSTLTPVLVNAMNALTGQNFASPDDWFTAVREYKGRLGTLFREKP